MTRTPRCWLPLLLTLLLAGLPGATLAAEPEVAGRVIMVVGSAEAERDGESRPLWRRAAVYTGDLLRTGPDSSIQVRFSDGGLITLAAETEFLVREYRYSEDQPDLGRAFWRLLKGGFRAISGAIGKGDPEAYEVVTGAATIGIRGTHYGAWIEDPDTQSLVVHVVEGGVRVRNAHGSIDLGLGATYNVARATPTTAPVGLDGLPAGSDGSTGLAVEMPAWVPALPDNGSATRAGAGPGPSAVPAAAAPGVSMASINPNASANAFLQRTLAPALAPSPSEQARLSAGGNLAFVAGLGAAGLTSGPGTLADDGSPLFLLEDGSALLRQAGANSVDVVNNVNGFEVSWGVFDPADGPGGNALLLRTNGDSTRVDQVADQVLWLLAAETDLSNLVLNRRYGADVAFLGQGSAGAISQLDFFLEAGIDLGTGAIEEGLLLVEVGGGLEEYRVNFIGNVAAGAVMLDITEGIITLEDRSTLPVDLDLSRFAGLFTGDDADAFTGQFYLQEDDNPERFVQGVLLGTPLD